MEGRWEEGSLGRTEEGTEGGSEGGDHYPCHYGITIEKVGPVISAISNI